MGIQGLLPLLKPIQRQRHLSDFAGQTLAVDAYVWLHRGAYACATELATGKPTHKYVDFCMQRVRLLKHHGISPYLVFDGGPLPAKLGTEKERERKRAESIEKANTLARQGRHSEAREYYVKCVDISPQMAYQVIKALKVENVPYIVAPYEADAQLAYLEQLGLVDGIITEDSDLLVFGCKNVLFKLDPVSASVTFISSSDFGSPSLATESLSLLGWSIKEFRWMAMLSGCDYLPSIPGVGLKTAWNLLKKHKTVEKVVRAVRFEGKKDVPRGYIDAFFLAEKVFLHQRVYDPILERLVYLSDPSDDLTLCDKAESYIGRDIDPFMAKKIAQGDYCPVSLTEMKDINPTFNPNPKNGKPLPLRDQNRNVLDADKDQPLAKVKTPTKGILNFFSPVAKPSVKLSTKLIPAPRTKPIVAGNASGKRTLYEVMEDDAAVKKQKVASERAHRRQSAPVVSSSRFFTSCELPKEHPIAGPSNCDAGRRDKENTPPLSDAGADIGELVLEDTQDLITQEDGYLSPSPSLSRDLTPDISSPVQCPRPCVVDIKISATAEIKSIPSPAVPHKLSYRKTRSETREVGDAVSASIHTPQPQPSPCIFVRGSSEICASPSPVIPGPDLTRNFDDEFDVDRSSEIGTWDGEDDVKRKLFILEDVDDGDEEPPGPSPSLTPPENTQIMSMELVDDEIFDPEAEEALLLIERNAARERIAQGWKARLSFGVDCATRPGHLQVTPKASHSRAFTTKPVVTSAPPCRRRESTPSGRVQLRASGSSARTKLAPRRSDPYPVRNSIPAEMKSSRKGDTLSLLSSDDAIEEVVTSAKGKLAAFRFAR